MTTSLERPLRIGNAHGFWGDRVEAAAEMLALEPELDFVTLDFLAEVSMSILAQQQQRDPAAGYARDFLQVIESLVPYWRAGGRCRIITNAGGLNPLGCAQACQRILQAVGCPPRAIGVVSGDDVRHLFRSDMQASSPQAGWRNLDTGQSAQELAASLLTANAYLGAAQIIEALAQGADLVITGRVADPSLTVAPCAYHFGWSLNDWDRLAGATVAGHLIECGTQVTGGISTDWLTLPQLDQLGFPIVEVSDDGSCVVTKPRGSGGCVSEFTVKEQLLYEIGDPSAYRSPDVTVSFLGLSVREIDANRILVTGARGTPAPDTLKVSATWQDGYRAAGQVTIYGAQALLKAQRAAQWLVNRWQQHGPPLRDVRIEYVGAGASAPNTIHMYSNAAQLEISLRVAAADPSREAVERFTRSITELITAGPPGVTGYAEGRPRVHPYIRYWPCLVDRRRVLADVQMIHAEPAEGGNGPRSVPAPGTDSLRAVKKLAVSAPQTDAGTISTSGDLLVSAKTLMDIAHARSGDKGRHANIGVIARHPAHYQRILAELTASRVADYLGIDDTTRIDRYELPHLNAVNFVIRDILDPLRLDAQGKTLGQVLLQMPLTGLLPTLVCLDE